MMEVGKRLWLLLALWMGWNGGGEGVAQALTEVERLLEGNGIEQAEEGYGEMVQTLQELMRNPLDVNRAGFDEWKRLFLLSDSQIDRLLAFRARHGAFGHLRELLLVPGFGERDLENILPFVTLGKGSFRGLIVPSPRAGHELLARVRGTLPRAEGYRMYRPHEFDRREDYDTKVRNRFHGPPVGSLLKYRYRRGDRWQAGITLENDPGEGFFVGRRAGFDFVSAHVGMEGKGTLRRVVLGDYRVQWGQGLVAWGGFASGKSDVAVGNEKPGRGVTPYTSADENRYLRGAALALAPGKEVVCELFFSHKRADATLVQADTLEEDFLTVSLYEGGYHRNDNECAKRHALRELAAGASARWNARRFRVGANVLYYNFTPGLVPGNYPYRQYGDSGRHRLLASVDYKTAFRGIYLFGETAVSREGAVATVNGVRAGFPWLAACLLYRRYDKRYASHYAAGFGEFGNTANEEGVYGGVDVIFGKGWKCGLCYDAFRFFAPRYRALHPGWGGEFVGTLACVRRAWEHAWRYKYEDRPEDLPGGLPCRRRKQEVRYQVCHRPSGRWEWRTRLTLALYAKDGVEEQGFMVFQDAAYTSLQGHFKVQGRVAWFDTDSYHSRIYAYEHNVLYGYSFPAFMDKGVRAYVNLRWRPLRPLTCYLKAGFTCYPGRTSISSGLTEVEGNKQCDLVLQVRLAF